VVKLQKYDEDIISVLFLKIFQENNFKKKIGMEIDLRYILDLNSQNL